MTAQEDWQRCGRTIIPAPGIGRSIAAEKQKGGIISPHPQVSLSTQDKPICDNYCLFPLLFFSGFSRFSIFWEATPSQLTLEAVAKPQSDSKCHSERSEESRSHGKT
ncbi:MAG: hypothetical protein ACLP7A_07265 [Desulfobaccales bacterium]